ncbi:tRNA-aminoacylation cofactor arc1-like [Rutidosis leptorrhynchoides]|uniref:tRNA-aminoacylation cofactor arc1-like n=1 Tax=Rutidosis leptorrhynchoides TaxID=125765 RepID=UPI003A99AADB
MASVSNGVIVDRKRTIVSALCKLKSVDATKFMDDVVNDLKSLSINIAQTAIEKEYNEEFNKWVTFAENFPSDPEGCSKGLSELNEYLRTKTVLVGGGYRFCDADIIVFSTVHPYVISLPDSDKNKLPHLFRWMDYIQSTHNFGELFQPIVVKKAHFDPPLTKLTAKVDAEPSTKKAGATKKLAPNESASSSKADTEKKSDTSKKPAAGKTEAATEKKKAPEKVAAADEKDKELSVGLLKIQVGFIRKASKHPSADSLLVEEIDVGEGKCRQVVSGLAKYCTPEELQDRLVVLITNVKPGKLRDVLSEGLVLCASNADHTAVEPLIVPKGAKIGECVTFYGHEGKPEDVLNPKKKQLDKITPNLFTDEEGVAKFKDVPFMTSAGPCTSTIRNATVK